ncbi:MerR family transcriptional regulator [Actinoplanes derwentensis]|uniref:DNA-binding transcriptional regulator, MerR family n=1 Tax=Actinoplanes derwentensis TaxID=113562 RepID=A0A1H1Y5L4_9ACTN|nr:MerR family transcriptional regulator [Actinoplanes derwentensis]GID86715.1 transcriptional regulator, MerR family protein [Actinoplanes derwentensis]SDT16675.1 DNA-binding transcriptional regulator, MerR family [Actinoplanes derwentensis]
MRMKGGWSTREIAEFAGTTLKTVRHYHRIGLLDEPERSANGYKKYGVQHLIRLMRIRRLVDLGVALADIATIQLSAEGAEQKLRALDAELAASIERQQRMRAELAVILRNPGLVDSPAGFEDPTDDLSDLDRTFMLLGSRIFEPEVMEVMRSLNARPRTSAAAEFDALTGEASEETRQDLAVRFATEIRRDMTEHPLLGDAVDKVQAGGDPDTQPVLLHAVVELLNAAQIDVMQRANAIIYPDAGR